MSELYPLKFHPIFKDYIWGGSKLKDKFNKNIPATFTRCAESWEISGVQDNISVVSNGYLKGNDLQELIEIYMADIVGEKVYEQFGVEFPLLIKLIDAKEDLSIQVHPNDEIAKLRHHAFGKTEMWYVIDSEPGSKIITGFDRDTTPDEYLNLLKSKNLVDVLKYEDAKPDDVFFIPPGTVHAIGKGLLIAEIQQTSDITYRIYDWDRVDTKGKPRELHTDLSLDVINYRKFSEGKLHPERQTNKTIELIKCNYFTTNRLSFNKSIGRDYNWLDSFVVYICIEGEVDVIYNSGAKERIYAGETILIPADLKEIILTPLKYSTILEIFVS